MYVFCVLEQNLTATGYRCDFPDPVSTVPAAIPVLLGLLLLASFKSELFRVITALHAVAIRKHERPGQQFPMEHFAYQGEYADTG